MTSPEIIRSASVGEIVVPVVVPPVFAASAAGNALNPSRIHRSESMIFFMKKNYIPDYNEDRQEINRRLLDLSIIYRIVEIKNIFATREKIHTMPHDLKKQVSP